jgi:hypothetical protein
MGISKEGQKCEKLKDDVRHEERSQSERCRKKSEWKMQKEVRVKEIRVEHAEKNQ